MTALVVIAVISYSVAFGCLLITVAQLRRWAGTQERFITYLRTRTLTGLGGLVVGFATLITAELMHR